MPGRIVRVGGDARGHHSGGERPRSSRCPSRCPQWQSSGRTGSSRPAGKLATPARGEGARPVSGLFIIRPPNFWNERAARGPHTSSQRVDLLLIVLAASTRSVVADIVLLRHEGSCRDRACSSAAVTAYAAVPAVRPAVVPVQAPRAPRLSAWRRWRTRRRTLWWPHGIAGKLRPRAAAERAVQKGDGRQPCRDRASCAPAPSSTWRLLPSSATRTASRSTAGAQSNRSCWRRRITASPISAYLDIDQIIKIAKENGVSDATGQRPHTASVPSARFGQVFRQGLGRTRRASITREPSARDASPDCLQVVPAIHPGYGFLSESPEFAQVRDQQRAHVHVATAQAEPGTPLWRARGARRSR